VGGRDIIKRLSGVWTRTDGVSGIRLGIGCNGVDEGSDVDGLQEEGTFVNSRFGRCFVGIPAGRRGNEGAVESSEVELGRGELHLSGES
jgi:hypothetical protein